MIINHLMQNVFSASLCSSLFVIIIILLRKLIVKLISATGYYYAYFCIFIPWILIGSPWHFLPKLSFFSAFFITKSANTILSSNYMDSPIRSMIFNLVTNGPKHSIILGKILCLLWLTGVTIFISLLIFRHIQFVSILKKNTKALSNEDIDSLKKLLDQDQHHQVTKFFYAKQISSPMLCHLIKPTIYLPDHFFEFYTPIEQVYILRHELLHLNRYDLIANTFLLIFICFNWFNPIIFFAYRHFRHAQELSCDAMVTRHFSSIEKKAYGYALIKTIPYQSEPISKGSCWWNTGIELKERCQMLRYYRSRISSSCIGLAGLIITTLSMIIMTSLEYRDTLFFYSIFSVKSGDFVIKIFNNITHSRPLHYIVKRDGNNLAEGLLETGDKNGEFITVNGFPSSSSAAEVVLKNTSHQVVWDARILYDFKKNKFTTRTDFIDHDITVKANVFPVIHTITFVITLSSRASF